MGRTSAPRRRVTLLSTTTRRCSRRGREVLLGKQDLRRSGTAPEPPKLIVVQLCNVVDRGTLSGLMNIECRMLITAERDGHYLLRAKLTPGFRSTVPDSTTRPHPARLDGEVDGELAVQHPTTPPILSALPPSAAMRKEWVKFDWGPYSSPSTSPTARGRWGRIWDSRTNVENLRKARKSQHAKTWNTDLHRWCDCRGLAQIRVD